MDDDDGYELSSELELCDAVYPDELKVVRHELQVRLLFSLELSAVRLLLNMIVINESHYPRGEALELTFGPKVRGLTDERERALLVELRARAHELQGRGEPCVFEVLQLAQERATDLNEHAECGVCLERLGTSAVFRASCWHSFHRDCLAAWWLRVARTRDEGTGATASEHQRQQTLRAVQSQLDTKVALTKELKSQIVGFNDRRRALRRAIRELDGEASVAENTEGDEPTRSSLNAELRDTDAAVREAETRLGVADRRCEALRSQLATTEAEVASQRLVARRTGVQCPVCRTTIKYEEAKAELGEAASRLRGRNSTGESDPPLPAAWAATVDETCNLAMLPQTTRDFVRGVQKRHLELTLARKAAEFTIDADDSSLFDEGDGRGLAELSGNSANATNAAASTAAAHTGRTADAHRPTLPTKTSVESGGSAPSTPPSSLRDRKSVKPAASTAAARSGRGAGARRSALPTKTAAESDGSAPPAPPSSLLGKNGVNAAASKAAARGRGAGAGRPSRFQRRQRRAASGMPRKDCDQPAVPAATAVPALASGDKTRGQGRGRGRGGRGRGRGNRARGRRAGRGRGRGWGRASKSTCA